MSPLSDIPPSLQVSVLDTPLFITSGLARVLTSSLLELSSMPRLAEAVIASVLRIYTSPQFRAEAALDLAYVVSPYTELPHSDQCDQVKSYFVYFRNFIPFCPR